MPVILKYMFNKLRNVKQTLTVTVSVITLLLVGGCGYSNVSNELNAVSELNASSENEASPSPIIAEPNATPDSHTEPFDLYTHCGIWFVQYDGKWFERVGGLLDDGNGNPPDGWGNPYHTGTLMVQGDEAIFTDTGGRHEVFHYYPDAEVPVCS